MKAPEKEKKDRTITVTNATNQEHIRKLDSLLCELYATIFRREFFGTISIRLAVQEGIIQHIQYSIEKSVH